MASEAQAGEWSGNGNGACMARAFELAYRLGLISNPVHCQIPDGCSSDHLPEICEQAGATYRPKGEIVDVGGYEPVIVILWEQGRETGHALFTYDLSWMAQNGMLIHGVHSVVTFGRDREKPDGD